MTTVGGCAVYARLRLDADPAAGRYAVGDFARCHGMADPVIYLDDDRDGQCRALAALTAAVTSGRHDAVLLAGLGTVRGCPARDLRRLLLACTRSGVAVDVFPAGTASTTQRVNAYAPGG